MCHTWGSLHSVYLSVAHRNTHFAHPESSVSSVTDLHLQSALLDEEFPGRSPGQLQQEEWKAAQQARLAQQTHATSAKSSGKGSRNPSMETTSGSHPLPLAFVPEESTSCPGNGTAGQDGVPGSCVLCGGTLCRGRAAICMCLGSESSILPAQSAPARPPWQSRAAFALNSSAHRLVQPPGRKADFVPPLWCKWDTKTPLRSSKAKGLPVNCKISLLCVGLASWSIQSLSSLLGFVFSFPFQALHPGPHSFSFTVAQLLC